MVGFFGKNGQDILRSAGKYVLQLDRCCPGNTEDGLRADGVWNRLVGFYFCRWGLKCRPGRIVVLAYAFAPFVIECERTASDWARSTFWTVMPLETVSWMGAKFQIAFTPAAIR